MRNIKYEIWIGIFVIISLFAVLFLCLKVANVSFLTNRSTYQISAIFDNIGSLKLNSPVKIGGVVIGRVVNIILDEKTFIPKVFIDIKNTYNHIPDTSSLTICTAGLIGEQYLALNIGFSDINVGTALLKHGSIIQNTKSAIVLEDLIGQLIYNNHDYLNH